MLSLAWLLILSGVIGIYYSSGVHHTLLLLCELDTTSRVDFLPCTRTTTTIRMALHFAFISLEYFYTFIYSITSWFCCPPHTNDYSVKQYKRSSGEGLGTSENHTFCDAATSKKKRSEIRFFGSSQNWLRVSLLTCPDYYLFLNIARIRHPKKAAVKENDVFSSFPVFSSAHFLAQLFLSQNSPLEENNPY